MESKELAAAQWIWYPGDFEIWLGNRFNNRRTERGAMFPPFWKQDSHYPTVEFSTTVALEQEEVLSVCAEGDFNISLDGKLMSELSAPPSSFWHEVVDGCKVCRIRIPKGEHRLNFKVWNQRTPPSLFVDGASVRSGSHWKVTYEDKLWIDENGVAHGSGIYVPAASWNFSQPDTPPSKYSLCCRERRPVASERVGDGTLYDFGGETFGHLDFRTATGSGTVNIFYGESREEALDKDFCETLDRVEISNGQQVKPLLSKAFRYVYTENAGSVGYQPYMLEEYSPHDAAHSGSFSSSDSQLNAIWDVAVRTMDLTTQEFFMDGIKRDRWTWSGDAIQSYLMNYYLRFDSDCVKRTIRQLRGKDPVTAHVNTIMDYTFYWFKSILDYYDYTADADFVSEMWPRMVTLMDYVLSRTDGDGMAEGKSDDWIFVDWTDFPMHKRGTLCFEQILFWKSLQTMAACAVLTGADGSRYKAHADRLADQIRRHFWCSDRHAFLHALEDGVLNPQVTKFPNMFAIIYGFCTPAERDAIMKHVMQNPDISPITTPYMRFYELETLCMAGQQPAVLREIKDYWGGMLREGATTFWEKYVPAECGIQHLAMYGRPYGKSLCHAWGASPVYLLGRYFLGVRPTKPGYEEFEVAPCLGGLEWMEGAVPTPGGLIRVAVRDGRVSVHSDGQSGWLVVGDSRVRVEDGQETIVDI